MTVLLSRAEAARRLGISFPTFDRIYKKQGIPYIQIGGSIKVPENELDAWVEKNTQNQQKGENDMNEMNVKMVSNIQRALGIIEGATYHIEKPVADIITHAIDMIEESVKNMQIVETHGAYPTREVINVDWYERLSALEYVYNPSNDGPWYKADDVWACIDPGREKEEKECDPF